MSAAINNHKTATLEEAFQRFVEGHLRGQQRDIDDFVRRYPQHEAPLRKRIHDLREIDALFDSILQAEGSELEGERAGYDLVGQKIGGFEIEEVIGRGGMGIVYLARDTKLKRRVAVKSMPARISGDLDSLARFRREAEILASLNHPNIAVIHEIIEDQESDYLVLEYVPGETLTERMAREQLGISEALSVSQQVAEGISAAHKKGIVHRDLKPGNVRITPEGRVKVLDFGLAKSSSEDDTKSDTAATECGRVMGTPAYMSPEQARGECTDHRTDIWSFGCILYQMLTGRFAFEGRSATETLTRILRHEPDWEALPQETPVGIRTLMRRCLAKDLDSRLGDIGDAAREIVETLRGPPVTISRRSRRSIMIAVSLVILVLSGVTGTFLLRKALQAAPSEIRLVVLPYEHVGSAEDEDLTAGITIEITDLLAKIHKLSVISYRSAVEYRQAVTSAQHIAKELSVDYMLDGTVHYERPWGPNSPVRITSRLTKTSHDTLIWSKAHSSTKNDVLPVLSDVARQVAQALNITLSEEEHRAFTYEPPAGSEAHIYYMRGNEYSSRPYQNENDLAIAVAMYEKAIDLDDRFALAHAKLSHAYSGMHWFHDRSEEHRTKAWEESRRALELDPGLPEGHWARGVYYYWGHLDHDNALRELDIARKGLPKNSRILATIGHIQRRQGDLRKALANYREAFDLDPLSGVQASDVAVTLRYLGEYPEAEDYCDRAISLAPDEPFLYTRKAHLYLVWKGSPAKARRVLDEASPYIGSDDERIARMLFELDVLDGRYEDAWARLPLESPTTDALSLPDALRYAHICQHLENEESAKGYYRKARRILEAKVEEDPNGAYFHCMLGIVCAGLGETEEAIEKVKRGVKLAPANKDYQRHLPATRDLALVYAMVGEDDAAIDTIEYLLSIPGVLSKPLLRIDPTWDLLRDHPRFQEFLKADR